jgi:hypothetical protein
MDPGVAPACASQSSADLFGAFSAKAYVLVAEEGTEAAVMDVVVVG